MHQKVVTLKVKATGKGLRNNAETYCPFKDRVVKISYEYSYNTGSEAFTNYGYGKEKMLEVIHNVFRADIQTIFSTIKFNVDREKMQKAGLISEEKAYRVKF